VTARCVTLTAFGRPVDPPWGVVVTALKKLVVHRECADSGDGMYSVLMLWLGDQEISRYILEYEVEPVFRDVKIEGAKGLPCLQDSQQNDIELRALR
jgi:hypothetical protein